jgi:hypothetical protein
MPKKRECERIVQCGRQRSTPVEVSQNASQCCVTLLTPTVTRVVRPRSYRRHLSSAYLRVTNGAAVAIL